MSIKSCLCTASLLLLNIISSVAQSNPQLATPPELNIATKVLSDQFISALANNASLYTGPEYLDYTKVYAKKIGHQLFMTEKSVIGDVTYDGNLYKNIPLLYDIRHDQLITILPDNQQKIRLNNALVQNFNFDGHKFQYIIPDSSSLANAPIGFYDILLDGDIKLLARRSKRMQEHPRKEGTEIEFTDTDRFYLQRGSSLFPISSKNSVIKILKDKRKELQAFAQKEKLSFLKDSKEAAFIQMTNYYYKISN